MEFAAALKKFVDALTSSRRRPGEGTLRRIDREEARRHLLNVLYAETPNAFGSSRQVRRRAEIAASKLSRSHQKVVDRRERLKARQTERKAAKTSRCERLVSVALVRDDNLHKIDVEGSHYQLRQRLGDDPMTGNPLDIEGFMTSAGRFVTRAEAETIALASGQLSRRLGSNNKLLSSDIDWNGGSK